MDESWEPKFQGSSLSFKLQFECTNNEVEYESLIQALELEKNMGIRCLWVFGDSELVINQVKKNYGIKKSRLKEYVRKVWDLMKAFQVFNITLIHKEKNPREDSLAMSTLMFIPDDFGNENSFKVLTLYWPTVVDNEEALQVFENHEEAQIFFAGSKEEEKDLDANPKIEMDYFNQDKIISLKINNFP